ncbi:hypothetical protein [Sedimenticola hydrogenitrophicus]|uniref:hypothetical protein n=1 Tax=Sedimenticola hydrogenitrophicus TaxID=2967975 RepID=UPI0023B048C1|nr:hypothetical protein [Sedimenticola hydrogenitrophicus]
MLKKFIQGIVFGAGAAIAFVAVWLVAMSYVIPPAIEKMANKSPDMSGAQTAKVLPVDPKQTKGREYFIHKGREVERKIPDGGGMLSISVLEDDGQQDRPSTFQAWVTESEAYIISTVENIPTVKQVDYPKSKAVDYASKLVSDNVGFKKQNMTMPISDADVTKLKSGQSTNRGDFYNGEFRVTDNGVVFLLPNKYEHNQ